MSYANPNAPNLPDFTTFVAGSMQINATILPPNSWVFPVAFNRALNLVVNVPVGSGYDYTDTVYNCAGHILIRIAPDQPGANFFRGLRDKYKLLEQAAGVVSSTGDASTSTTLAVPDALAQLTLGDLQFMKTPWGRSYLEFNQDFGGIFGLS